jgi:orotidine-5'-phosphate decarboxylase
MIKGTSATTQCGILVNVSRAIIYASDKENFAEVAGVIAKKYQVEMASYLPF